MAPFPNKWHRHIYGPWSNLSTIILPRKTIHPALPHQSRGSHHVWQASCRKNNVTTNMHKHRVWVPLLTFSLPCERCSKFLYFKIPLWAKVARRLRDPGFCLPICCFGLWQFCCYSPQKKQEHNKEQEKEGKKPKGKNIKRGEHKMDKKKG